MALQGWRRNRSKHRSLSKKATSWWPFTGVLQARKHLFWPRYIYTISPELSLAFLRAYLSNKRYEFSEIRFQKLQSEDRGGANYIIHYFIRYDTSGSQVCKRQASQDWISNILQYATIQRATVQFHTIQYVLLANAYAIMTRLLSESRRHITWLGAADVTLQMKMRAEVAGQPECVKGCEADPFGSLTPCGWKLFKSLENLAWMFCSRCSDGRGVNSLCEGWVIFPDDTGLLDVLLSEGILDGISNAFLTWLAHDVTYMTFWSANTTV